MMCPDDEIALVEQARQGDRTALKILLLVTRDRLKLHISSRLPPDLVATTDPEDILHDTWLAAFRSIASFEPRGQGSFYAWIRTIAENRLKNAAEKERADKRGGNRRVSQVYAVGTDSSPGVLDGLANAIRERMACNELDEVGILHERLAALGYEHVSLALRAAEARNDGDLLSELKAYAALVRGLPPHAAESRDSFARYAGLLEATWQFEEALLFSRRAEALGADHDAPASRRLSAEYAEVLRGDDWVVEPDLPLTSLIDAATAADKPFQGMFVLRTLGELRGRGAQLTPQAIVQKYEQERNKAGREPLPQARHRTVCWLTRNRRERFDLVLIEVGPKAEFAGLVFCLKVVNAGLQTVMVPAVLFKAPSRKATTPAVRHNQRVHQRLSNVSSAARANGWLDRVDRTMRCALRRLLTEELVR